MSREIDQRIVEMQFNNRQFESGVQTSLNTLDKLKKSLDFNESAKSLSNLTTATNHIDLSSISAGIEALQNRFSALGIVGMQIIQNLTNAAMNLVNKIWSSTIGQIISGGKKRAMNIENARFQLQGLLQDEARVQAVMDAALDSVDGTAYAFDEAARAASQFAATGLEAGDSLDKALRGITGVAAMTNSEYEGISQIFTTIAGNGRVMGQQLLQLSTRGLNAAVTLADFFNGVNDGSITASESVTKAVQNISKSTTLTESDIRGFVSKGVVNFEIFSAAMDDAFGEHAKKANDTFTGAMANVRAALSRIGAEFISPLVAQNGPLVEMFNVLRVKINEIKKEIGPFAKAFTDSVIGMSNGLKSFLENLDVTIIMKGLQNILEPVLLVLQKVKEAFRDIFPETLSDKVKKLTDRIATFNENFAGFHKTITIKGLFSSIEDGFSDFNSVLKENTVEIEVYNKTITDIKKTFKGFFAIFDIFGQVISAIVRTLAPFTKHLSTAGKGILDLTGRIGDYITKLAKGLKANDTFYNSFQKLINYISNAIPVVKEKISIFVDAFKEATGIDFGAIKIKSFSEIISDIKTALSNLPDLFHKVTTAVSNFIAGFTGSKNGAKQIITLSSVLSSLGTALGSLVKFVHNAGKSIGSGIRSLLSGMHVDFYSFGEKLAKVKDTIGSVLVSIKDHIVNFFSSIFGGNNEKRMVTLTGILEGFGKAFKNLYEVTKSLAKGIVSGVRGIIDGLWEGLSAGTIAKNIKEIFKIGILSEIYIWVGRFVQKINSLFTISPGGIYKNFADILFNISTTLTSFTKQMRPITLQIRQIATSILILAAALLIMSAVDASTLGPSIAALSVLAIEMAAIVKVLDSSELKGGKGISTAATTMIKMAAAILILAIAVKKIAKFDPKNIAVATTAIGILAEEMALITRQISSVDIKTITLGLGGLISFALAILVLSSAVKKLAKLDVGQMVTGLLGVSTLIYGLYLFSKHADLSGITFNAGAGLLLLSTSISILASSVKKIGDLNISQLVTGLIGVGVLISALASFTKKSDLSGMSFKAGTSLILLSSAIAILAGVVKNLASLDADKMIQGLIGVGAILAGLKLFTQFSETDKGAITSGAGLLLLSASLVVISNIVKSLGSIDFASLLQGLAGMAAILTEIVIFTAYSGNPTKMLAFGAALIVMGVALNTLALSLKVLSTISLGQMLVALAGLAATFLVLGVSAQVITRFVPALLALSAALLAISTSTVIAGVGLTALSGGIVALVSAVITSVLLITDGVVAIVKSLGIDLPSALEGAVLAFGSLFETLYTTLVTSASTLSETLILIVGILVQTLIGTAPMLVTAVTLVIKILLEAVAATTVNFLETAVIILTAILNAIVTMAPRFGEAFLVVLNTILTVLVNAVPNVAAAGMALLLGLLQGILSYLPAIVQTVAQIIITFINTLAVYLPQIIMAGINLMVQFINGMADGLRAAQGNIFAAVKNLLSAIIEFFLSALQEILSCIPGFGDTLAEGLESAKEKVREVLAPEEMEAISDGAMEGLVAGIESNQPAVAAAATSITDTQIAALTDPNAFSTLSQENMASFLGPISDSVPLAGASGGDILGSLTGSLGDSSAFSGIGTENIGAYLTSFDDSTTNAAGSASGIVNSLLGAFKNATSDFKSAGGENAKSYIGGVNEKKQASKSSGSALSIQGSSGASGEQSSWRQSGINLAQGLINGLNAMQGNARSAGRAIGRAAKRGLDDFSEMGSPSKLWNKEGGVYLAQGLINGLVSMQSAVSDAGEELGRSGFDGASTALSMVNDMLSDDMDLRPTITPVIRSDNLQRESDYINGLFADPSLALSATYGGLKDSAYQTLEAIRRLEGLFTNSNLQKVGELVDVVERYLPEIAEKDLTLDERSLVDRLAPGINRKLGVIYR